jgi:hypothetical protein
VDLAPALWSQRVNLRLFVARDSYQECGDGAADMKAARSGGSTDVHLVSWVIPSGARNLLFLRDIFVGRGFSRDIWPAGLKPALAAEV